MRAGTSEYDRFGPWIDEVTNLDEVPPLYRDFPLDLERARLVLKVPRNISRRNATPDMDLYDALLVLDEEGFTFLSRRLESGSRRTPFVRGYDVTKVPYSQVVAVLDTVELLHGLLTIFTKAGPPVVVPYGGSGRPNIARLVSALRAASAPSTPSTAGRALLASAARLATPPVLEPGQVDVVFVNDFDALARDHADLVAWTCHGRSPALPRRGGWAGAVRRVVHLLAPRTLHGGIVAGDGAALEIVGRKQWLLRTRATDYSRSRLVLPLGALERIEVLPHERYVGVSVVRFGADSSSIEIAVPDDSAAFGLFEGARTRSVGAA